MIFLAAVSFVEVLQWIGYIIVALLCLMVMIVVHEAGHYAAGKFFNFTILEYSIGFGPKIFQRVNKETGEKFSLRWIPLGGYCQFKGEDEDVEEDPGAFNSKPAWQRIIVLFSGAFMNFITAIIFVSIFFSVFGEFVPKVYATYDYVDTAYTQQLQKDDVILQIDGKYVYSLSNPTRMKDMLQDKDQVVVTLLRNGEYQELTIPLREYDGDLVQPDGETKHMHGTGLGISVSYEQVKIPFFRSIGHSFVFAGEEVGLIFKTLGSIITGHAKVSENMGGTVTTITVLSQLASNGFMAVMYGFCVLSVSIGIMNLLPFPALDGCRIIFCIVEWIRRKPNNRKIEAIINLAGLVILVLMAVTFDLLHFLG